MKKQLFCTIDIGGTKLLLLLIDQAGKVVFRESKPTPVPAEPLSLIAVVKDLLAEAATHTKYSPEEELTRIGICIAGFIETEKGIVHQSPNLFWEKAVPLQNIFEGAFKCPVIIENDANAAVVGEVYYGSARGHSHCIYVTISTGIGGGLFLNGRLYRGSKGFAGEIGHIKPFGQGRTCRCGGNNCLEIWASGGSIADSARELLGINDFEGQKIDTAWVFNEAEHGNRLMQRVIEDAACKTGQGLANLVTLLNPGCIVVGGGVAAGRPGYLEKIIKIIRAEAIRPAVEVAHVDVVPAALEPEAGIWGMYALMNGQAVM